MPGRTVRTVHDTRFVLDFSAFEAFADELEAMKDILQHNLEVAMIEFSMLAEEGTRALVHHDTGELEMSIHAETPHWEGDEIHSAVSTNNEYAIVRHEAPYRMGTTGDKYDRGIVEHDYYVNSRGRRTREKPNWRGMPTGRKYMERAIVAIQTDGDIIFGRALDMTLRGERM